MGKDLKGDPDTLGKNTLRGKGTRRKEVKSKRNKTDNVQYV
jgi:hypothetical protein